MGLLLRLIILISVLTESPLMASEKPRDQEICPEEILDEALKLPSFDTLEGEQAFLRTVKKIYLSLISSPPEIKSLLESETIKINLDNTTGRNAAYDPSLKTIFISRISIRKHISSIIETHIPKNLLTYYYALMVTPTFSHEMQHAFNSSQVPHLYVKEDEFSAFVAGYMAAAELSAQFPDLYDLYYKISGGDHFYLDELGDFIEYGPDSIWENDRFVNAFDNLLTLDEAITTAKDLTNNSNATIREQLDDLAASGYFIYGLFDETKNYSEFSPTHAQAAEIHYDSQMGYAYAMWANLNSLPERCGDNFMAPPSHIQNRITQ